MTPKEEYETLRGVARDLLHEALHHTPPHIADQVIHALMGERLSEYSFYAFDSGVSRLAIHCAILLNLHDDSMKLKYVVPQLHKELKQLHSYHNEQKAEPHNHSRRAPKDRP